MKRELLHIIVLLMLVAGVNKAKAQTVDEIYWSEYAKAVEDVITEDEKNPKYVLLFDRGAALNGYVSRTDAFLSNGGNYGMQGILSNIGNRFYITKTVDNKGDGVYLIHSNTTNKVEAGFGNCLSIDEGTVYMDRGDRYKFETDNNSAPNWKFELYTDDTDKKCYYITNVDKVTVDDNDTKISGAGLYYDNINKIISYSATETKEQWCIILENDYRNVIDVLAKNSYVDVTGLIHDAGFNRFNDYEDAWKLQDCNNQPMTEAKDITPANINLEYIKSLEEQIQKNNEDIENNNSLIKEIEEKLSGIDWTEITNKKAAIEEKQAKIAETQEDINKDVGEKAEIERQIDEIIDGLFELGETATADERNAKYKELKSKMIKRDEIIKSIDTAENQEELNKLVEEKENIENEILAYVNENRSTKIDNFDKILNEYLKKERFAKQWQDVIERIDKKVKDLETLADELKILKEELEKLEANIPEGYDKLVAEKTEIEQANDELKGLNEQISSKITAMTPLLGYKSHVIGGVDTERKFRAAYSEWWNYAPWNFWMKYGKDFCAGIYACGEYNQTIENLPAGTYRIVCTGFNSGTDEDNASLVINGKKVPMPLLGDMKEQLKEKKDAIVADAKVYMSLEDDYYYQGLDVIAAAQLLDANRDRFTIDYYVEITADQVKDRENKIVFGFSNNNQDDVAARDYPVFADNFQLMYTNMEYVAYISANNPENKDIDRFAYERPVDLYVRRAFTPGWNSIVLPFDITVGGLAENFGDGAKLSKLMGINPERPSQIKFENTATLKAGECGLIYVPEDAKPCHADPKAQTNLTVLKEFENGKFSTTNKPVYGPLYLIKGATRAGDEEGYTTVLPSIDALDYGTVSKSYKTQNTENGKEYVINFKGYYYKYGGAWPVHSYIVDHGHMYYLSSDWGKIYGTMWYLSDFEESSSAPSVRIFEINGVIDNTTTEIDNTIIGNNGMASGKVYNINGQYMGTAASSDNLPKGMYIVNGKKFVVR